MNHIKDTIKQKIHKYRKNVVYLTNKHFKCGTYRITKPGIYVLKEDIVFDPNPDNYGFPTYSQLQNEYSHSAFFLGFFSAITIETSCVMIDLNGYDISQSKMHCLQQRFFQTIQLNDSPFIIKQGPSGKFADSGFNESKYICICNGTMGLTSHYCIHGNNNSYVLIDNIKAYNFETGAIALNKVDNLVIQKSDVDGVRRDTPVTSLYSVLRNIIILFENPKIKDYLKYTFRGLKGNEIKEHLMKLQDVVIGNYINNKYKSVICGKKDRYNKEIVKYIHNNTGLNDGSSIVGIQITPKGVAIDGFHEVACPESCDKVEESVHSSHIYLYKVNIRGIIAGPVEVVCCKGNKNVIGAMGEVIDVYNVINNDYKYHPTIINDAHFWIAKLYQNMDKSKLPTSTVFIPDFIINWAENGENFMDVHKHYDFKLRYGLDIMAHTNKGSMGLRLGGSENIQLSNVLIDGVENIGIPSKVDNRPNYGDRYEKSKTNIEEELGDWYSGNVSYGIVFTSDMNVKMHNVVVRNCSSKTGKYYEYFYNNTPQIEVNYN